MQTIDFSKIVEREYSSSGVIKAEKLKKVLSKFRSKLRGGVRLRNGRAITRETLDERRKKAQLP